MTKLITILLVAFMAMGCAENPFDPPESENVKRFKYKWGYIQVDRVEYECHLYFYKLLVKEYVNCDILRFKTKINDYFREVE